jgi:hypothetical protein
MYKSFVSFIHRITNYFNNAELYNYFTIDHQADRLMSAESQRAREKWQALGCVGKLPAGTERRSQVMPTSPCVNGKGRLINARMWG